MTQDVHRQVHDLLLTMNDYLSRLIPGTREIADCFYGEESNIAWEQFSSVTEGLQWLFEANNAISHAGIADVDYRDIKEKFTALELNIGALSEAFQNKEFTMVGDLLNYEICPNLEDIQRMIGAAVR